MTSATVGLRGSATPIEMIEAQSTGQTFSHQKATFVIHSFESERGVRTYQSPQPESENLDHLTHRSGWKMAKSLRSFAESRVSVAASTPLTSRDYRVTLDRIRLLNEEEDVTDRPSDYAYGRTVELLRTVANRIGMHFPTAIAVTGPSQSIRLLWARGEQELRVTVGGSPRNKSYLYWLVPGQSGIEHTLDGQTLYQYLNWLIRLS